MKKHIPNILTISRIVLVPCFWWLMTAYKPPLGVFYALLIFILASTTDYFDGKFARKYNVTNFGKIMDPIADKLLTATAFYLLATKPLSLVSFWPLIIVLARELVVTALRTYYIKKNIYIAANFWGKLKTGTQIGVIIIAFVFFLIKQILPISEFAAFWLDNISVWLIWTTVGITVFSGITYFKGKKI